MSLKKKAAEAQEKAADAPDDVRKLRREVARLNRELRDSRAAGKIIVDAVEEILEAPASAAPISRPPASKKKRTETHVLHLTDLHFGLRTPFFATEVAHERLDRVVRKAVLVGDLRRSLARADRLVLLLGGDIVQGDIIPFPKVGHVDRDAYTQGVVEGPTALSRAILELAKHYREVDVYCVPGNHGRVHSGKRDATGPRDSWDLVCYRVTELMTLGRDGTDPYKLRSRVRFNVAEAWYALARVHEWGLLLVHGDAMRGFAGFPWYGAGRKAGGWADVVPLLERAYGVDGRWDHLYLGHHHTMASAALNTRKFFATGSLVGYDAYAASQLAAAGPASQRLNVYDAEHGCIAEHELLAEDVQPATKAHVAPEGAPDPLGPRWTGA